MPNLACLCHFLMLFPAANLLLRTYVGHPKGWKCLIGVQWSWLPNDCLAVLPVPVLVTGVALSESLAIRSAYGQRFAEITLGHFVSAWRSTVVACSWRSLILFSAIPFWKCALTTTICDQLPSTGGVIYKSLVGKSSIVSVAMLDNHSSLLTVFFESHLALNCVVG
jgi:hypothetical protein